MGDIEQLPSGGARDIAEYAAEQACDKVELAEMIDGYVTTQLTAAESANANLSAHLENERARREEACARSAMAWREKDAQCAAFDAERDQLRLVLGGACEAMSSMLRYWKDGPEKLGNFATILATNGDAALAAAREVLPGD